MTTRPILFSGPMVRALLDGSKTQTRRIVKGNALEWLRPGMFAPAFVANPDNGMCPYGQPGDRLWVRETTIIAPKRFATPDDTCVKDAEGDPRFVQYLATSPDTEAAGWFKLKKIPSIFMPRWASRLTLEITEVRVQRVQEISEEDAREEGCEKEYHEDFSHGSPSQRENAENGYFPESSYEKGFEHLWDSINAKPREVRGGDGEIASYVSYPWAGEAETKSHRGRPWVVVPNPWVWALTFKRIQP